MVVRSPLTTRCRDRFARQDPRRADLAAGHGSTRRRGRGRSTTDRDGTRLRSEVVAYLRSLPALWADSGPDGRQALALALFARTEVIGFEQMSYQLTPEAIELGLNAALPPVYELKASIAEFGRGERSRADTIR